MQVQTLRLAARDRRQNLVLAARERVASEVAKAGLAESANLTESECSSTTEWWRSRVRAAQTIEEISRLQVNFRKLKQLQEDQSCIDISSGSEGDAEWPEDSEARLEYFRNKVLKMFDKASFVETSSGVGQSSAAERGESSSPTVDLVVSPTGEWIGHWSTETESEVIPETPPPPGMVGP